VSATSTLLATSNAAFYIVFGVFVVAMLVLAFLTMRWAIRRDKVGLAEWRRRKVEQAFKRASARGGAGGPNGNGHGGRGAAIRGNGARPPGKADARPPGKADARPPGTADADDGADATADADGVEDQEQEGPR
jgi:hypothetical protein